MPIFSMDSKFMQAMNRLADLMLLNLLFLVTCLPVFTIGAASTALYSVTFRIGTDREERIFRCYFRAFRDNFKQGTGLFLALFLPGVLLLVCLFLSTALGGALRYLALAYIPLLLLLAFVYSYAFPLLSQFYGTVKLTLKNALLLSIGYFPRTVVMVVLNLLPLALFYAQTMFFFQVGILWFLLYFSAASYLNAQLLRKIFAPYQPSEEDAP